MRGRLSLAVPGVLLPFSAVVLGQAGAGKKEVAKKETAAMKFVATDDAPRAIRPYSQAVELIAPARGADPVRACRQERRPSCA